MKARIQDIGDEDLRITVEVWAPPSIVGEYPMLVRRFQLGGSHDIADVQLDAGHWFLAKQITQAEYEALEAQKT